MDRIERYLDQVCRGIAGPRSLRHHIRQELAEHLRDAAAVKQAAGLSEEEAFARALEDFGGPEQVRAELEATHGHRMLTVVVDKALQWKEMTMKARWIWSTWAHVAVLLVLALEVAFIYGCVIFIVPKFKEMAHDGWIDPAMPGEVGAVNHWGLSVLNTVVSACEAGVWIGLGVVALWALFEWRVRSENKTLMRLAALGTIAVKLGIAAFLTAAALILPLIISGGPMNRWGAHRIGETRAADLDDAMKLLDAAITANDWPAIARQLERVRSDMRAIQATGLGQPIWEKFDIEKGTSADARFHDVQSACRDAKAAAEGQDEARFKEAIATFREAYARVRPAAAVTAPR